MPLTGCKKELQNCLRELPSKKPNAVVMPDFFMDRLIDLKWDTAGFSSLIMDVAKRKGGSIDGIPQNDIKGGNAINVASALASLGFTVTPIICTSKYGLQQIKYHFRNFPLDTSHVKIREKASITTALELQEKNGKTNVMLRDLGSLADFGPQDLNDQDFSVIDNSDFICLFDWAGTVNFGTELAETIFGRAKSNGRGKTYFDTADPTPNRNGIHELMEKVLKTDKVDVLSLNENEAVTYASMLDKSIISMQESLQFAELAMNSARVLAKRLPARIDLHTTAFSATLSGKKEVVVPTFKIEALRATGAGDAWNAGNILGDAGKLSDECRLTLANAVSACYLSDQTGTHPTRSKLLEFLNNNRAT